jgi:hypothetical protein
MHIQRYGTRHGRQTPVANGVVSKQPRTVIHKMQFQIHGGAQLLSSMLWTYPLKVSFIHWLDFDAYEPVAGAPASQVITQ